MKTAQLVYKPAFYGEGCKRLFTNGEALMRLHMRGRLGLGNQLLEHGDMRAMTYEELAHFAQSAKGTDADRFRGELRQIPQVALPEFVVHNGKNASPVVAALFKETLSVELPETCRASGRTVFSTSFEAEQNGNVYSVRVAEKTYSIPDEHFRLFGKGEEFACLLTASFRDGTVKLERPAALVAIPCFVAEVIQFYAPRQRSDPKIKVRNNELMANWAFLEQVRISKL